MQYDEAIMIPNLYLDRGQW